jgi:hypothetical protein
MSDGIKLTQRQIYLLRASFINGDSSGCGSNGGEGFINPPWLSSDRGDLKILERHLLMKKDSLYNGWTISGLGKDLLRKIVELDKDWLKELAEDHISGPLPYR